MALSRRSFQQLALGMAALPLVAAAARATVGIGILGKRRWHFWRLLAGALRRGQHGVGWRIQSGTAVAPDLLRCEVHRNTCHAEGRDRLPADSRQPEKGL